MSPQVLDFRPGKPAWRLLALTFLAFSLLQNGFAAVFTVTNVSPGTIVGSLRWAITNANATPGTDTIAFRFAGAGPYFISPSNSLPTITDPVIIDGTTQTNFAGVPKIELIGTNAGSGVDGFDLQAPGCVIRGLAITRFNQYAISIANFGGNTIQGCYLGTGVSGTNTTYGNGSGGISIASAGNLVGGTDLTNRNIISGNGVGLYLVNAISQGNQIQGNYIGTDVSGTRRIANNTGVFVDGALSNVISGNLISGNTQGGVFMQNNSIGNVVAGNLIGPNAAGTGSVTNAQDGVILLSSGHNLIGGTDASARNVISGNAGRGVLVFGNQNAVGNVIAGNYVGTTVSGTAKLANGTNGIDLVGVSNNIVGGSAPGAGNLISGNTFNGVSISTTGAIGNVVQGNFIGTDASTAARLPNTLHGVIILGSNPRVSGNLVTGNIISGNAQNGVYILGAFASNNVVQGNFIGTDSTGQIAVSNGFTGVRIEAPFNTVGGTTTASRNVISGNGNNGVYLYNSNCVHNAVLGNFIGTGANGLSSLPNTFAGIGIESAPSNTVGGNSTDARNIISGNDLNGIYLLGKSATQNTIAGNYIGLGVDGFTALSNGVAIPLQDDAGGIDLSGAVNNLIGGEAPGAGNVISANMRNAMDIGESGISNVILGNIVGTSADGSVPMGNEWNGVELLTSGGMVGNVIGSETAGNHLSYAKTGRNGVRIRTANAGMPENTNNLVRGNFISHNTALGIDIGATGVTTNDNCDSDLGGNRLQNFPVVTSAVNSGASTTINGTLNSAANTTYLLQFYANTSVSPSGYGEGETYLGSTTLTTGSVCGNSYPFSVTLPLFVAAGRFITATATDPFNNTSEFSIDTVVGGSPRLDVSRVPGGDPSQPQLLLSWVSNSPSSTLQQTTNLDSPIVWSGASGSLSYSNGAFYFTTFATNGSQFFRLSNP